MHEASPEPRLPVIGRPAGRRLHKLHYFDTASATRAVHRCCPEELSIVSLAGREDASSFPRGGVQIPPMQRYFISRYASKP